LELQARGSHVACPPNQTHDQFVTPSFDVV